MPTTKPENRDTTAKAAQKTVSCKRFPTYCPLHLRCDFDLIDNELAALIPRFESLATTDANIQKRHRWFDIAKDTLYQDLERFMPHETDPDRRAFRRGKIPSWWGMSLTHVPGRPETLWGSSRYRRKFDGGWVWNDAYEVPATRAFVETLPLSRIDVVRVLSLPPGGLGPVHVDCQDDTPWETDGIASISVLLRDGGVSTRFQTRDGALHDVNDRYFFFKDCVPHGIPQVSDRRLLLRINGRASAKRMLALMDMERAIW